MDVQSRVMDLHSGERQVGAELSDIEPKHVERYKFAQKYCTDKDVLDAACGCGYGSNILSKEAKSVLGIDNSQETIDYARNFWVAENITFRQADINSDLTTLGKFDVVVSLETVEHLDTPISETCRKFYKILRPGGLLIVSHPEKEALPGEVVEEQHPITPSLIKRTARIIERAPYHLHNRHYSVIWGFISSITWGFIKSRILRQGPKSLNFHKHFNIDGELVKNSLINIGFQIKDEWYQPGRFYFPYHLIVGEKSE